MQNKITLSRLAAMMAEATGKPRRLCEDFLRELFALAAESLAAGENVKIKGFGTFKLSPVDARKSVSVATGDDIRLEPHTKITFIASKELAAAVNAPFEMFESMEVADAFSISDDAVSVKASYPVEEYSDGSDADEGQPVMEERPVVDKQPVIDEPPAVSEETRAAEEHGATEESMEEQRSDGYEESASEEDSGSEKDFASEVDSGSEEGSGSEEDFASEMERCKRRIRFSWGFLAGFISAVLVCLLMMYLFGFTNLIQLYNKTELKAAQEASVAMPPVADAAAGKVDSDTPDTVKPTAPSDSVSGEMVGTKASDQLVYDTITHTRYLTTMAKEHYGNFNLWPYIYKENEKILGHPDRIRPGTKVVVPPLWKYGVDPTNPAHIRKAKQMGIEIYSRFK